MAVTGKQRAGKGSRVQVTAINLNMVEWTFEAKGDDLDTTNFESAGNEQGTIGIIVADFQVRGDWDAGRNPYDSPPGIYPRDDLSALKFYENVTDNIFHSVSIARLLSTRNGSQVRGKVTFEFSGKSNSGFTLATGSI